MEDKQHTIGLTALLDEVSNDLDALRKKNPSDYSIKHTMQWWELEKERLLVRHGPACAVKKPREHWWHQHALLLFTAGAVTWAIGEVALVLLRR